MQMPSASICSQRNCAFTKTNIVGPVLQWHASMWMCFECDGGTLCLRSSLRGSWNFYATILSQSLWFLLMCWVRFKYPWLCICSRITPHLQTNRALEGLNAREEEFWKCIPRYLRSVVTGARQSGRGGLICTTSIMILFFLMIGESWDFTQTPSSILVQIPTSRTYWIKKNRKELHSIPVGYTTAVL